MFFLWPYRRCVSLRIFIHTLMYRYRYVCAVCICSCMCVTCADSVYRVRSIHWTNTKRMTLHVRNEEAHQNTILTNTTINPTRAVALTLSVSEQRQKDLTGFGHGAWCVGVWFSLFSIQHHVRLFYLFVVPMTAIGTANVRLCVCTGRVCMGIFVFVFFTQHFTVSHWKCNGAAQKWKKSSDENHVWLCARPTDTCAAHMVEIRMCSFPCVCSHVYAFAPIHG